MATVVLQGTLDTKEEDCLWVKTKLQELSIDTLIVDVGSFSTSLVADISSEEVIRSAGEDPELLRERHDRGEMMEVMGRGAARLVSELATGGQIHGFLSFGGSGGSAVAAPVMQTLPIGFPKLLVSTMASGDVSPYVGSVDTTIMYSVVDVAGINSISEKVLGNAVAAIAGMANNYQHVSMAQIPVTKPVIGISMFGLTTPAASEAKEWLLERNYEVQIFHATGSGGRSLEKLIESGLIDGVLDLTTTELADELIGGVLTAGPNRLTAAGKAGIPQVVSLGAIDMVNFGPKETVPEQFADRNFVIHNPTVTLMRTTKEENAQLGKEIGEKLRLSTGNTEVFVPTSGFSGIDCEDGQFWDPEADQEAIRNLENALHGSKIPVHKIDVNINDEGFGRQMAEALHNLITKKSTIL
ncbi:Tm-1-like ATP-binding domain-containing protein [Trueperella pyogenes]|uniref:Tm-1-like ATP-binding domain-containing protein n=1 Tax=Trueperella pyogenes TaxID=1661 RepID=UPI003132EF11